MALLAKEYKRLLEIVEIAHSAPDRASLFQNVCLRLERLVPMSGSVFIPADPRTGDFCFAGHLAYNTDARALSLFCSCYAPLHPIVAKGLHVKLLREALRITDLLPAPRLSETAYVKECASLNGHLYELCWTVCAQGDPIGGVALFRTRKDPDFTDREREVVRLLIPHLSRAIHNLDLICGKIPSREIGRIVLGEDGRSVYINEEANRALQGRPASSVPDPGEDPGPVFFRSERGTYRVRTARGRHRGEKLFFLEPLPTQGKIRARLMEWGLSRRQQEVALLAIRGLSNREIAERLFIAEQTVKDHLQDIFEALNIRRRSELTAKVLGL